jgi:predicted AAA+ superfamily ATPase
MPTDGTDERTQLLRSQQVLRNDAVERTIYKDIPQSFGVDNPLMLERVLYVLAGQTTKLVSPTNICHDLDGLSPPTFERYLAFLEKAFIVFTLPNYSGSENAVQRRGRKVFFIDGAIRNAALQRGFAPLTDPVERGMLMENLVASTLHSLAVHNGVRLFHWRDGKQEVDFIYDDPEHPMAFEIGSSAGHTRAGLRALIERHPRFAGRSYIVTPGSALIPPDDGIGTIPLDLFLVAVGRQAEAALRSRLTD